MALTPLHSNQHAYKAGKSVETAFHRLVVPVEKALDQQEIALGAFLDREGAFNSTSYDTMCIAVVRHSSANTIVRWIRATLEGRVAVANLNEFSLRFVISRGCPQGGVLSPLLWCLVVDGLITRLSGSGVFIQGYADDTCLLAVGKFPQHGIRTHAMGPFNRRYGATRSDCQLIQIRLGSLLLPERENFSGSLNHSFLGLSYASLDR